MKQLLLRLVLALSLFFPSLAVQAAQSVWMPEFTSRDYAAMSKDNIYVIMFTAPYCGPCIQAKKTMLPDLIKKYEKDDNVLFYMLDVENDIAAPDGTFLYTQWGIQALPTFVVVYNDAVMYARVGFLQEISSKISMEIENIINALK